jgi:beta-1,4-N-acetylglucosaminyltransferase
MALKPTSASVPAASRRECFITVGATASFRILLDSVLTPAFVDSLADLGYTHLTIQCGPDVWYAKYKARILEESKESAWRGIKLALFDFNKLGLGAEMRGCKGVDGKSIEGVVVCHAGQSSSSSVHEAVAYSLFVHIREWPGLEVMLM